MFNNKKRSFFEKLTGSIRMNDGDSFESEDDSGLERDTPNPMSRKAVKPLKDDDRAWEEDMLEEGQLSVDVHQTPSEIIITAMVAGVRPEDIQLDISRDMITIRGKREENRVVDEENYYTRELYWGAFSRTISLPQEVEPDEAVATEKHGLLVLKLPKIDKGKRKNVRVKSL